MNLSLKYSIIKVKFWSPALEGATRTNLRAFLQLARPLFLLLLYILFLFLFLSCLPRCSWAANFHTHTPKVEGKHKEYRLIQSRVEKQWKVCFLRNALNAKEQRNQKKAKLHSTACSNCANLPKKLHGNCHFQAKFSTFDAQKKLSKEIAALAHQSGRARERRRVAFRFLF